MRDTDYATEIAHAALPNGSADDDEVRVERLRIKATGIEEVRFSWWRQGRMIPRPLDLPEPQLIQLLARGIRVGVLSADFLPDLRAALERTPRTNDFVAEE